MTKWKEIVLIAGYQEVELSSFRLQDVRLKYVEIFFCFRRAEYFPLGFLGLREVVVRREAQRSDDYEPKAESCYGFLVYGQSHRLILSNTTSKEYEPRTRLFQTGVAASKASNSLKSAPSHHPR
jgi:hypothetical protein